MVLEVVENLLLFFISHVVECLACAVLDGLDGLLDVVDSLE